MLSSELGLVGDIGATSARFALLYPDGKVTLPVTYASADYEDIANAIVAYLADETVALRRPTIGVLAVAAPVIGDQVTMTNHPWSFSIEKLQVRLGLKRLQVINDFAANAYSIPDLQHHDLAKIGGGHPISETPMGVVGPGTGFGVSALIPSNGQSTPLQGEGGHVTMSSANARESAVLELMRQRYDHVSAERVLSGPGLVNLYNTICEIDKVLAASYTSAQITDPKTCRKDSRANEATLMFCSMLGTIAGNLALTLGARAGIYIAGGIVPRMGTTFGGSQFRARFESKGRFRNYLERIPTYVIMRPLPALLGAARLLRKH